MKKLYEYLGINETKGTFGIEIECEGVRLQPVTGVWRTEADGSLRGDFPHTACEWVLTKPLPLGRAITAIASLAKQQKEAKAVPNFSYRTSTHVHVNMQDMNEDQYLNFIYTWLLLEEPMIRFCGEGRKANRFCLSINDGEGAMDYLSMMFRKGFRFINQFMENDVRYAALNIAATKKYGSLEIRCMRGSLDVDVLSTWLIALQHIRDYACEKKNVRAIHDEFVNKNPRKFMEDILKDVFDSFDYKTVEDDLRNNFSVTIELAYLYNPLRKEQPAPRINKKLFEEIMEGRAFLEPEPFVQVMVPH